MGMRDESWCNGCGCSVPYSDAEEHYCGECAEEYGNMRFENFIDLIKQFREVKLEEIEEVEEFTEIHDVLTGAIETCEYFLMKAGVDMDSLDL
jgi:hypothetical protein